jgi:hypothetical protein
MRSTIAATRTKTPAGSRINNNLDIFGCPSVNFFSIPARPVGVYSGGV